MLLSSISRCKLILLKCCRYLRARISSAPTTRHPRHPSHAPTNPFLVRYASHITHKLSLIIPTTVRARHITVTEPPPPRLIDPYQLHIPMSVRTTLSLNIHHFYHIRHLYTVVCLAFHRNRRNTSRPHHNCLDRYADSNTLLRVPSPPNFYFILFYF